MGYNIAGISPVMLLFSKFIPASEAKPLKPPTDLGVEICVIKVEDAVYSFGLRSE